MNLSANTCKHWDPSLKIVNFKKWQQQCIATFINGLKSSVIRQRLLKTENITLQRASKLADSMERAHKQAVSMGHSTGINMAASIPTKKPPDQKSNGENTSHLNDDDGNVAVSVTSKARQQIKGK